MTDTAPESAQPELDAPGLFLTLRRKEGNWVEWGQACQQLQKAGYSPQTIFEETGFEPIQQNQVIVGAQVYASIVAAGAPEAVQTHYQKRGSDILYEFRILTQAERAAAAELALDKQLDMDGAKDIAKAIKEYSRRPNLPEGFSNQPGDAVAYQCWHLARQKSDLQERSRLIAQGLQFAQTPEARKRVEQLLTDFTVVSKRPAPWLPIYRLESDTEMPRILPVVGRYPLTESDLLAVPLIDEIGAFRIVKFGGGEGAWVPLPGWQAVMNADDPVAILWHSDHLPNYPEGAEAEEVMVVVDRAERQWNANSYFIFSQSDQLQMQWFEENPGFPLLGRVILIMRPKKILDERLTHDPWQVDE